MTREDIKNQYMSLLRAIYEETRFESEVYYDYRWKIDAAWVNYVNDEELTREQLRNQAKIAYAHWAHKRSNWVGYRRHKELAKKIQDFIHDVAFGD